MESDLFSPQTDCGLTATGEGLMNRLELFQFPLDIATLQSATERIQMWIATGEPRTVITLNPEIVIQSETHTELRESVTKADLITADGVGILWAAKVLLGVHLPERVTGIDLTIKLLEQGGRNLRVFYLGGQPGTAERAAQRMLAQYGTIKAGTHHGYFQDDGVEDTAVAQMVQAAKPHILLTALGAGRQENFNERFKHVMNTPVSIGVGGTLDVLAGTVERAPKWTSKVGMEWAWRVVGDRKRWSRAPRLALFVRKVLQVQRNSRLKRRNK